MTCQACKDKPRGKRCGSCGKLPPVLEVKTEECPVLFHTVEVEGNIKDNPPEVGRFRNTLAVYKEDDYKILYNSDGIPSNLGNGEGISDFNDLRNRPKYAGEAMTGNTNIPDVADAVAGEATIREAADERLEGLIGDERTARQEADGGLQTQIDALAAASDVTDIVGTYAELQAYDTSKLNDNDIIKVLQDETHDDETTYYRWIKASNSFSLIGEEGPYYTKAAADAKFQDKLVAGSGITIDPDTNEISADGSETIFYANLNETGTTRHIYKDINFTTAASAQDIIDANNNGQVILRGTSTANPTAYNDSYLQNAFIMPHNNDYEFVFLDRDLRYEYTASATTDTAFYYDTSEIQSKLTAGSNVQITGTTISATDTTYSNFVGTDGQTAGAAGLVPAPATTDAGKYLKADGTWDSVQAGPNVVQTIGASTTDVMSQAAVTGMVYQGNSSLPYRNVVIGDEASVATQTNGTGVVIGYKAKNTNTVSSNGVVIGPQAETLGTDAVAIGYRAKCSQQNSVSLGTNSVASRIYEVSIGSGAASNGTRYIANVTDPQLAQDAATKNYTDNLVINYSAINGATAPTTATEAKYIGQLYYDTTNDDMYYCSAITAQGTDPETYTYAWSQFGGGGATLYSSTGTNTDGAMTQLAASNMIYPSGSETSNTNIFIKGGGQGSPNYVCIGPVQVSGNVDTSNGATAIGGGAMATGTRGVAITAGIEVAQASGQDSIAIRGKAQATNSIAIGRNANVVSTSTGSIAIGYNAGSATSAPYAVALGKNAYTNPSSIAIGDGSSTSGNDGGIAIGRSSRAFGPDTMAIGENITTAGLTGSVVIGNGPSLNTAYATRNNEFCVHASTTANQPMVHSNVDTPTLGTDAANKNYVDTRVLTNAGAPTTSTVGVVGQLLEDTTNGKLYQCTDATNPYVWTEVGAGGTIPTKTSDLINDGADGTSTYVEATDIADVVYKGTQITTTSPNIISTPMIQDGAVTAAKLGNDVNFLSLTMSTTDIGEGAPLAANTLYGVYQ